MKGLILCIGMMAVTYGVIIKCNSMIHNASVKQIEGKIKPTLDDRDPRIQQAGRWLADSTRSWYRMHPDIADRVFTELFDYAMDLETELYNAHNDPGW